MPLFLRHPLHQDLHPKGLMYLLQALALEAQSLVFHERSRRPAIRQKPMI